MLKLDFSFLHLRREIGLSLRAKENFFSKSLFLALFFSFVFHLLFFSLLQIAIPMSHEPHPPLLPTQVEIDLGVPKNPSIVFAEDKDLSNLSSHHLPEFKNFYPQIGKSEDLPSIFEPPSLDHSLSSPTYSSLYPLPLSATYQPFRIASPFPLSEKCSSFFETILLKATPTRVSFFIYQITAAGKTGHLLSWTLEEYYGNKEDERLAEKALGEISFLPLENSEEREGLLQIITEQEE